MRTEFVRLIGLVLVSLLAIGAAQADDWQVKSDQRLSMQVEIPADMVSSGGDVVSQHYTGPSGNRIFLIHLQIGESTFEEAATQINEIHTSQGRWSSTGETITPSWAEWHAADGARQSVARILPACGGSEVILVKVDFWLPSVLDTQRVTRSLAAVGDGCL